MIVGLIVLVAVNILILSLSSRRPYPAYGPGRIAISFVAPFQEMIVGVSRFLQDIWDHYFFLVSVVDENNRLKSELWKARSQQHQYRETMLTNERLRQLLDLQESMQQPLIAAQVIGKDPSPWFRTIMIDKGTDVGVSKGRPVINPEGIVGLVVEATAHNA
ncbi:MAG: rod shape-determining protein MreC, partial [Desulfobacteraceae bacterium]